MLSRNSAGVKLDTILALFRSTIVFTNYLKHHKCFVVAEIPHLICNFQAVEQMYNKVHRLFSTSICMYCRDSHQVIHPYLML